MGGIQAFGFDFATIIRLLGGRDHISMISVLYGFGASLGSYQDLLFSELEVAELLLYTLLAGCTYQHYFLSGVSLSGKDFMAWGSWIWL